MCTYFPTVLVRMFAGSICNESDILVLLFVFDEPLCDTVSVFSCRWMAYHNMMTNAMHIMLENLGVATRAPDSIGSDDLRVVRM